MLIFAEMVDVDWAGWATFAVVATVLLTLVLAAAQMSGRTRLDLPLVLGTLVAADPDRARAAGLLLHVLAGQFFALFYAAGFASLGGSQWWLGAAFGLAHGLVALVVLLPLLPGVHPRMASERAGLSASAGLEPPGVLALHYGRSTPIVTLAAHVVYGITLALVLRPR